MPNKQSTPFYLSTACAKERAKYEVITLTPLKPSARPPGDDDEASTTLFCGDKSPSLPPNLVVTLTDQREQVSRGLSINHSILAVSTDKSKQNTPNPVKNHLGRDTGADNFKTSIERIKSSQLRSQKAKNTPQTSKRSTAIKDFELSIKRVKKEVTNNLLADSARQQAYATIVVKTTTTTNLLKETTTTAAEPIVKQDLDSIEKIQNFEMSAATALSTAGLPRSKTNLDGILPTNNTE